MDGICTAPVSAPAKAVSTSRPVHPDEAPRFWRLDGAWMALVMAAEMSVELTGRDGVTAFYADPDLVRCVV